MNRETTVPEEAVEILAALLYDEQRTYSQPTWTAPDPKPPGRSYLNRKRRSMWRNRARKLLQAALPVLRSEWEASLLSDEAVEAATVAAFDDYSAADLATAEVAIEAALNSGGTEE
jgi:hypothetical protein